MTNQVERFLVQEGASQFWARSACDWIRRAFNSNSHFVISIANPRARIEGSHVKSFQCSADIELPDANKKSSGVIRYSFSGKGHKVTLTKN